MHATEFLSQTEQPEIPPVVVLSGGERFLKQRVQSRLLSALFPDEEKPAEMATQLEGKQAEWRAVLDELKTISMFGGQRCVCIGTADDFVSSHRAALENYVLQPSKKSLLLLDVKSWPKNTKLAKKVAKTGLAIECSELKGAQLGSWVVGHAKQQYDVKIPRGVAEGLIDLAGTSLGLLDQELDKLASYVGEQKAITIEDVQSVVGGWRLETTWAMINAVRDGFMDDALIEMNKLITSGEAPQKLLGGINFVYRKLTAAVRTAGPNKPLNVALKEAGVFPRDVPAAESYLRKLGRPKAERIPQMLMQADLGMKGDSSLPPRVLLERLLVQLAPGAR